MGKVLIIGAGGVGTVVAHKCAQNPEVFSEIVIASRTKEKCDRLAEKIGAKNIVTDQVDADSVEQLVELMNRHKPELVINVALPYQDLTIMAYQKNIVILHCHSERAGCKPNVKPNKKTKL